MFTVSSAFKSLSESVNPFRVNLKFTFSGSEEDVRLLNAVTVSRRTGQFSAGRLSVNLANTDTTSPVRPGYNLLQSDKTHFFREGVYSVSFTSNSGTESEDFPLFTGKLADANFRGQKVTLSFFDKYDELKKRTIGDDSDPIQFVGSLWNPADLFWTIVTSWGRLDSTAATSNTDIDYTSWLAWKDNADFLSLAVRAEFKGTTVVDAIKALAEVTNSIIVGEADNKIYPSVTVPTAVVSAVTIADSTVFDLNLRVGTNKMMNKAAVLYDYDPANATFAGSYVAANSTSVNTFGVKEELFSGTTVWHGTKQSAQAFLDIKIALLKDPVSEFRAEVGYFGLPLQLNDPVFVKDVPLSMDGTEPYAITGLEFNAGKGLCTITAENRLGNRYFFLDHAALGLLDQLYNPIF